MDVFVARQPIFDADKKVQAYELLFRSGLNNYFDNSDGNAASTKVISNSFLLIGINAMTGGKRAFINFTRDLIVQEYPSILPTQFVVVEILEHVEPEPNVIAACKKLKQMGYTLALDDFVFKPKYKPLIELADIIKIDFMNTDPNTCRKVAEKLGKRGIKFLAEKVETQEEFEKAKSWGYSYFQGYFFAKPTILSHKDVPGFKLNMLQILREVHQGNEINYNKMEDLIKRDVSLSYKLLRYINSAIFGWLRRVESIKQALVLLGDKNIKTWVSLLALANMGEDKPAELIVASIVRAKFCEGMATKLGTPERESDLFLLGMFSMIDAIVDRPLPEILSEMPLAPDVKEGLLGTDGKMKSIICLFLTYEAGNWEEFGKFCDLLGVKSKEVPELYLNSVEWAGQIYQV